jgi:hypothetical protein
MKKVYRILFLCGVVALPQLAMADQPSPQALGMVQAILNFCAEVDPHDAASFQAQWKVLSGGVPAQQLASIEDGSAYKQAYDLISGELGKTSKASAAGTCAAGASWTKSGGASGKNIRAEHGHHEKRPENKRS